ncbi:MAG: peptidase M61 [Bacteroidetes bacterium]|nr:peptidase M61 [Bacteroidota bacterium]
MKKIIFLSVFFFLFHAGNISSQNDLSTYHFSIDLTKLHNDLLTVNLITPSFTTDTAVYRMPAIVPGTYKIYNFGRFVFNFHAYDKSGNELNAYHSDANTWKIPGAKKLDHLSYDVEDTWDSNQRGEVIFEPAGTNFQQDTNFVLNNHAIFGYFDGMKKNNYEIQIAHPNGFYGSSGLISTIKDMNTDTYAVPDYMQLVDGPIMYCRPDTAHILVGGADVLISVYSPHKLVTAKFIADSLRLLLDLQRQYLGGTLPVKNYAFIIYCTGNPDGYRSHSFGALEHSYSSLYTLLEMKPELIAQTIKDVSAHEFFHIVTPLSIHSKEIGDFDYDVPKMSEHLWMYEGLTEYAAHHVQIKYGDLSLDNYLRDIRHEMISADNFDDALSFTKMSKGCLDEYEDQYNNVYAKGALIGLCLDIRLRQLSDGKYGTQELMNDLSKKYGKDRSFDDDSLFSDIVKLTYPEIGDFFKRYVEGGEPLPFDSIFDAVGIGYQRRAMVKVLDPMGGYGIRYDSDGKLRLFPGNVNDFGREMKFQKGDVLLSFNGKKVTGENISEVMDHYRAGMKEGDKIKFVVKRNVNGKTETVKLKGTLRTVQVSKKYVLTPYDHPTDQQLKIRKAWINK